MKLIKIYSIMLMTVMVFAASLRPYLKRHFSGGENSQR